MSTAGVGPSDRDERARWLTPDERAAWLSLVGVMVKLPAALDAQLQRDAGLSYIEYMVLAMLSEQPERKLRMSELATTINASLSRLSHVANRLERQQLIRRESDPEDGRFTNAVLTEPGMEKVVNSAPGHVEAVRRLVIDPLTAGQLDGVREAGDLIQARIERGGGGRPAR
jgi:DNA-binding MarR family transcriptional regulator